ncbi:MAG: type I DNA topoisomerase [Patescibacteria group bacterium]|nr:type I DNA topoisomerase [Patescibacteria group bacterium]
MNLIIVESPAKAKTIEKYLGKNFKVLASFGHVRDLPQKKLGIDTKKDFTPEYEIPAKAKKIIAEIKKAEKNSELLYLATDLDREGEAISWHILKALNIKEGDPNVKRIVFNEITKSALENAVKHPRGLDMNLVDAQQARRVLDRLVGYKLSPLLWRKVKSGLSAGRVQSVAVRLVVEREREIEGFKPEEFWLLGANLSKTQEEKTFKAFLSEINGEPVKKFDVNSKQRADEVEKGLKGAEYKVRDISKKESIRKPSAPFTTSTLQMEASRKLSYSAKQTMMLAQKLYEAGRITYMRTDSTNLSEEAVLAIRKIIKSEFGDKYLPEAAQQYQTKTKRAQEAHEAIRPSHIDRKEVSEDSREQKLYDLIWKRTLASQMKEAIFDVTTVLIEAKAKQKFLFTAKGEGLRFDGFIRAYVESGDDETDEIINNIPDLKTGEVLQFHTLIKEQKFTEPPKRYTEAMLVKKLESLGIGRPSTYAPTLGTIQDRGYVSLIEKRFQPTDIAKIVNDLLVKHFSNIVDYEFTAKMEDELDDIAAGEKKWVPVIEEFYIPFSKNLSEKTKEIEKSDIIKPEMTDEKCPECGKPLLIRLGRYGKFMACSGYPECKFSKPIEGKKEDGEVAKKDGGMESIAQAEAVKCEKCGGKMVLKEGRFGKFLACENYPKCKNTKAIVQSSGIKCPDCGEGELVERRTKKGRTFWGCSRYPSCKYASWEDPKKSQDLDSQSEN